MTSADVDQHDDIADKPLAVAVATACYGLLMVVTNWRNQLITNDFTKRDEFVLFGGDTGFPGDFGRNVFAGTVFLGLAFVGVGVVAGVLAGTRQARIIGAVLAAASLVLVATFGADRGILGAKPSAAAVLLAVALYLMASSLDATRELTPTEDAAPVDVT